MVPSAGHFGRVPDPATKAGCSCASDLAHLHRGLAIATFAFSFSEKILDSRKPLSDRTSPCVNKALGANCTLHDQPGTCQKGECCTLDYAQRSAGGAPPRSCNPCVVCSIPDAPLEALVVPTDVSLAADATGIEMTGHPLSAPVTTTATEMPSSPTASVVAAAPVSAPEGRSTLIWPMVVAAGVVVALVVWRRARRRS